MSEFEELKSATVVYVEDDEIIRNNITKIVRRRVKEVYSAENGKEGFEAVSMHNPDIVITDIEMPVMNGLEMIRMIREKYEKDTPIIVITAYKDDEHFSDMADAYIYKPIDTQELFVLMSKLLKG